MLLVIEFMQVFGYFDLFSVYCIISFCKMLGILLFIYIVDVSLILYNMGSNFVIIVYLQNDGFDFVVIFLFIVCNFFRIEYFKEEIVEV